ncbi:MAG: hypothetical protein Q8835_03495, partial [Sweet potato little leaf phytoplasma]|nr:hypothetical protein [Sweet potato little leaf phytoplasma]
INSKILSQLLDLDKSVVIEMTDDQYIPRIKRYNNFNQDYILPSPSGENQLPNLNPFVFQGPYSSKADEDDYLNRAFHIWQALEQFPMEGDSGFSDPRQGFIFGLHDFRQVSSITFTSRTTTVCTSSIHNLTCLLIYFFVRRLLHA